MKNIYKLKLRKRLSKNKLKITFIVLIHVHLKISNYTVLIPSFPRSKQIRWSERIDRHVYIKLNEKLIVYKINQFYLLNVLKLKLVQTMKGRTEKSISFFSIKINPSLPFHCFCACLGWLFPIWFWKYY